MDKIEMLSRMWIECDPNRQPSNPDELSVMYIDGALAQVPSWRWFTPRAGESLRFFERHGFELRKTGQRPAAECDRQEIRDWAQLNIRKRSGSTPVSRQDLTACEAAAMLGALGGAEIGGEAAREAKRQRDLQVLAEAHQVANERGHPGLASSIAHLFGELHLDTAA